MGCRRLCLGLPSTSDVVIPSKQMVVVLFDCFNSDFVKSAEKDRIKDILKRDVMHYDDLLFLNDILEAGRKTGMTCPRLTDLLKGCDFVTPGKEPNRFKKLITNARMNLCIDIILLLISGFGFQFFVIQLIFGRMGIFLKIVLCITIAIVTLLVQFVFEAAKTVKIGQKLEECLGSPAFISLVIPATGLILLDYKLVFGLNNIIVQSILIVLIVSVMRTVQTIKKPAAKNGIDFFGTHLIE